MQEQYLSMIPLSNLHTITYDDGEIKQYNLAKKTWRLLSTFELGDIVECWKSTKSMFVPGIIVKVDKKSGFYKVKMFEKLRLNFQDNKSNVSRSKSRQGKSPTNIARKNAVSLRHCRSVIGSFTPSDSVDAFTGTSVGVQRFLKIQNIQDKNSAVTENSFSKDGTSNKASNMVNCISQTGVETKIKL